jgi:hypothetical protein
MKSVSKCILLIVLFACGPEENTPIKPIDEDFDPSTATLLRSGTLSGCGGHSVMGKAEIYDANGSLVLFFDEFTSQNGPDLRVYMSTSSNADTFVSLGKLKSVTGKQAYEIPNGTDVNIFKYAHIWCQQFSVCFGIALTN